MLICEDCSIEVNAAFNLRTKARIAEESYFRGERQRQILQLDGQEPPKIAPKIESKSEPKSDSTKIKTSNFKCKVCGKVLSSKQALVS